MITDDDFLLIM